MNEPREVTLDSRHRFSLRRAGVKNPATRYLVTPHADGSITLTPMISVVRGEHGT